MALTLARFTVRRTQQSGGRAGAQATVPSRSPTCLLSVRRQAEIEHDTRRSIVDRALQEGLC